MKPSFDDYEALPDVPSPVFHVIRSQDGKFVDGHNRLRLDLDHVAESLARAQREVEDHKTQLASAMKRTTDISSLRFTPQMVAAIVILCASIVAGQYASTAGLRSDQALTKDELTAIRTMISAQVELRKVESKLEDERSTNMAEAIKEIKARGEMTDLKVNNLRETFLTNRR